MITGADLPLTSIHGVLHRRPSLLRSTVVFSFFVGGSGSGRRNSRFYIPDSDALSCFCKESKEMLRKPDADFVAAKSEHIR